MIIFFHYTKISINTDQCALISSNFDIYFKLSNIYIKSKDKIRFSKLIFKIHSMKRPNIVSISSDYHFDKSQVLGKGSTG